MTYAANDIIAFSLRVARMLLRLFLRTIPTTIIHCDFGHIQVKIQRRLIGESTSCSLSRSRWIPFIQGVFEYSPHGRGHLNAETTTHHAFQDK